MADDPSTFEPGEPVTSELPARRDSVSPSEFARTRDRSHRTMLLAVRLVYMVLLVTMALLPFVGSVTNDAEFGFSDYAPAFIATFVFGTAVLIIDAATPHKKLASVFGIYLGIIAGLVGALAIGALLDLIAQSWDLRANPWIGERGLVKLAIGITLCYLAVSIVLTTKDDFRLVIPYVEFAKQVRGVRPLLLDSSAIIDGRIESFGRSGFLDAPLVVPRFVINELQALADSADRLKRARGRRGLDMVSTLQANPTLDVTIDAMEAPNRPVDRMLIRMAADQNLRILTTDYNLNKVAQIHGVTVLNLNDLANMLRPQVVAGDLLTVEITKSGESAGQGVGYLPEGTMVVVERARDMIGTNVEVVVTNALQTSAGRMIFARLVGEEPAETPRAAGKMAESATHQPRATGRPEGPGGPGGPGAARSPRNPRRG